MRSIALALAALALMSAKEQAQTAAPGVEPAMIYTGGPIITMARNTPRQWPGEALPNQGFGDDQGQRARVWYPVMRG